jgi:O-antigen/teichoic acid export membrane protein
MIKKIAEKILLLKNSVLRKDSFIQDLAIFTSGSSTAYIIGFLLTPIIARLYNDEAYGLFSLLNTIISGLVVFSTLNYSEALLIPKNEKKFTTLIQICLIITISFSSIIIIITFFFGEPIMSSFNAPQLGRIIYLIPIVVFLNALLIIWDSWNLRLKEFKRGAVSKVINISLSKTLTIVLGIANPGNSIGLILGEYLTKPLVIIALTSKSIYRALGNLVTDISIVEIRQVAIEYKNYPLYNLQSSWVLIGANHLPIYLISAFYSISATGQYSIAMSLLNVPLMLIGLSIAKVYMQRAIQIYNEKGLDLLRVDVLRLYKSSILISFVPFLILGGFGDIIFKILLGPGWESAGRIVQYLSAPFMLQFIVLPIKSTFRILRKEKLQLKTDLVSAFITVIGLVIVVMNTQVFFQLILTYGVLLIVTQLVSLYFIFVSLKVMRPLAYTLLPVLFIISSFALVFFIRLATG